MKTLAVFNSKGGVGKTMLVYHVGHMLARLGYRTLLVDLDPQANLTSLFFDEDRLEEIWSDGAESLLKAIQPRIDATGDVAAVDPIEVSDNLFCIAGDPVLERFEDTLSQAWPECLQNDQEALRSITGLSRITTSAGNRLDADVALIDAGSHLGAINRSALLFVDYLVVPVATDLLSLRTLRNLGSTIRRWRQDWAAIRGVASGPFDIPPGAPEFAGYIVWQHTVRFDRPTKYVARWLDRIPAAYQEFVLGDPGKKPPVPDPSCLATLRSYHSLMWMAQEVRKPMFDLKAADGAIGSHAALVTTCYQEFEALAKRIAGVCGL